MSFITKLRAVYFDKLSKEVILEEAQRRFINKRVCFVSSTYEGATIATVESIEFPSEDDLRSNPDVILIVNIINLSGLVEGSYGRYFICHNTDIFVEA